MTKDAVNPVKGAETLLARHWNLVHLVVLGCGLVSVSLGCLMNPYLVERYISSDAKLESTTVTRIFLLEGVAVLAGVVLLMVARAVKAHSDRKEKAVRRLLLVLASVIIMLSAFEGVLQFADRDGRLIRRQRHYFFEHDEHLGWRHKPGTTCYFKGTHMAINSKGLREREIPYHKPPNQFRMLFLGDSQLFGDGVSADETLTKLLEEQLRDVQTINAAVIGYGTDQQLLYLQREGYKYQPDLTIVAINAYDLQDNISHTIKSGYRKPLFELRVDQLLLTNVPVEDADVVERVDRNLGRMSCLYYLTSKKLKQVFSGRGRKGVDEPTKVRVFPEAGKFEYATTLTTCILAEIAKEGRKAAAKTAVLFLPYTMDFSNDREYRKKVDRLVAALRDAGKQSGFLVIDIRDDLATADTNDMYLDTMHFSTAGQKEVAAVLLKHLVDMDLIPSRYRKVIAVGSSSERRNTRPDDSARE